MTSFRKFSKVCLVLSLVVLVQCSDSDAKTIPQLLRAILYTLRRVEHRLNSPLTISPVAVIFPQQNSDEDDGPRQQLPSNIPLTNIEHRNLLEELKMHRNLTPENTLDQNEQENEEQSRQVSNDKSVRKAISAEDDQKEARMQQQDTPTSEPRIGPAPPATRKAEEAKDADVKANRLQNRRQYPQPKRKYLTNSPPYNPPPYNPQQFYSQDFNNW